MADVLISCARLDRPRTASLAAAIEASGWTVSPHLQPADGKDDPNVMEQEIDAAACVLVAWSKASRHSLTLRAQANQALDQGKLVQISLDGSKLPLPFDAMHWLDFASWPRSREHLPWPQLEARIGSRAGGGGAGGGRAVELVAEVQAPPLQGFDKASAVGWTAIAAALLLAGSIVMAARGVVSAAAFGAISIAAVTVSAALVAIAAYLILRTEKASRR